MKEGNAGIGWVKFTATADEIELFYDPENSASWSQHTEGKYFARFKAEDGMELFYEDRETQQGYDKYDGWVKGTVDKHELNEFLSLYGLFAIVKNGKFFNVTATEPVDIRDLCDHTPAYLTAKFHEYEVSGDEEMLVFRIWCNRCRRLGTFMIKEPEIEWTAKGKKNDETV